MFMWMIYRKTLLSPFNWIYHSIVRSRPLMARISACMPVRLMVPSVVGLRTKPGSIWTHDLQCFQRWTASQRHKLLLANWNKVRKMPNEVEHTAQTFFSNSCWTLRRLQFTAVYPVNHYVYIYHRRVSNILSMLTLVDYAIHLLMVQDNYIYIAKYVDYEYIMILSLSFMYCVLFPLASVNFIYMRFILASTSLCWTINWHSFDKKLYIFCDISLVIGDAE